MEGDKFRVGLGTDLGFELDWLWSRIMGGVVVWISCRKRSKGKRRRSTSTSKTARELAISAAVTTAPVESAREDCAFQRDDQEMVTDFPKPTLLSRKPEEERLPI